MLRGCAAWWALLLLALLILFSWLQLQGAVTPSPGRSAPASVDRDGLKRFLESQYVPEAGLLRAAVHAYPDNVTIWVASDNLLASRALEALGSPLAPAVEAALQRYGGGLDGLHEVLIGIPIPGAPRAPVARVLGRLYSSRFRAWFVIKYEARNGAVMRDWEEYADLIAYEALNSLLQGSRKQAEELFEKLMSMWDGYGFRDKAFHGVYAAYKLALAIYLYKALKAAGSTTIHRYRDVIEKCYTTLSKLQRSDGGIVTGYRVERGLVEPIGDANTETTSITALALYSHYPQAIGSKAKR